LVSCIKGSRDTDILYNIVPVKEKGAKEKTYFTAWGYDGDAWSGV
jgi:hypothetical protein